MVEKNINDYHETDTDISVSDQSICIWYQNPRLFRCFYIIPCICKYLSYFAYVRLRCNY